VKIEKGGLELRSDNSKKFELFKDASDTAGNLEFGYKVDDCVVMNQNWDTRVDTRNQLKLMEMGFYKVKIFPREFGGLGWILFKKLV
jgi:hypothetical protein